MNFFKSILLDDDDDDQNMDPPKSEKPQETAPEQSHEDPNSSVSDDPDHSPESPETPNSSSDSPADDGGDIWSFGGLIKTFTTRSESVLETYRRDLKEFGSGLKKETDLIREVASRAVKDLPNSIDVESVSHAIDGVIKSTAEIISQGKETLLASSDVEPETPDTSRSLNAGRYSRFDAQLIIIQNDMNTYCDEPEDLEDYNKWKSGFDLEEKSEEVENLIGKDGALHGIYNKLVPNEVDDQTFWCRYFYRVDKLKQQESVRANLVKRAISIDDEEELSWDVDDDDEQEGNVKSKGDDEEGKKDSVTEDSSNVAKEVASDENELGTQDNVIVAKEVVPSNISEPNKQDSANVAKQDTSGDVESQTFSSESSDAVDKKEKEENQSNADSAGKNHVTELSGNSDSIKKEDPGVSSLGKEEEGVVIGSEGKGDHSESGKDSDVSIISSQKSVADEEDMGWDEIEDSEGDDDKKATSHVASSDRADLKKRLSVADDDEDLSWDIEDDDEPVKA